MSRLAVIGLGLRATHMIRSMHDIDPQVRVVAVVDPDEAGARKRMGRVGVSVDAARFCPSADALLEGADGFDGVVIGTRCHLHTPMACKVAPTGLPLFLEKPVSITAGQLAELAAVYARHEQSVLVSFPLRMTPLYTAARDIVRSGRLGKINQIQANNNVSYGGCYFGGWYRNYDEVGGLWLQKATHDFDYLTDLLDARPLMIAATATQLIYGGDMPHDLRCSQCDQAETCIESHRNQTFRGDDGGMSSTEESDDHWCAFSREIGNQDAGSALILYEGGAHVSYAQNFVSRRRAARRGAILTGHRATLEFDWPSETIRVVEHHTDRVDEIHVGAVTGHSGGDHVLAGNFIRLMRGEAHEGADLRDALRSVSMCLAARESAHGRTFQPIVTPGVTGPLPEVAAATEVPVP